MTWVLVIAVGWLVLATLTAMLIGRSVRLADAQEAAGSMHDEPNFVVDPGTAPGGLSATEAPVLRPAAEPPTVPGIPVARPKAPGARGDTGGTGRIRRTGLG